jgi:hypothetical protein
MGVSGLLEYPAKLLTPAVAVVSVGASLALKLLATGTISSDFLLLSNGVAQAPAPPLSASKYLIPDFVLDCFEYGFDESARGPFIVGLPSLPFSEP